MTKEQVFELMNKNPSFHLATIDGNFPRVRGMFLYRADRDGVIFHTGAYKDLYRQVLACQNAELCFNGQNMQIRVSGCLEIVDDNALKDEIVNHPTRAFLQGWRNSTTPEEFYKAFVVLRLKNGTAVTWTAETNLMPKVEIKL
ncbi:MAG: pyridoxamine 5'-phosphate oxidase family protein [Firmicutes bacterium]|nr:pyridoxamine 5'-phosphate oxidase family protein [Bacillota bacterium]